MFTLFEVKLPTFSAHELHLSDKESENKQFHETNTLLNELEQHTSYYIGK